MIYPVTYIGQLRVLHCSYYVVIYRCVVCNLNFHPMRFKIVTYRPLELPMDYPKLFCYFIVNN